ncbi:MAG: sugar ABC transporter substrate-binding protein [Firmicutes bacterium]|nr:sugar ABC transporter substrate-binding protein [Bacillota bacterium]
MEKVLKLFIALLISTAFILSGCGQSSAPSGKIKLEFWTISLKPEHTDYIESLMAKYQKENPDIELEWIDIPINVMMQKLMASIAGGVSPDVVNLNPEYALLLAQNNALVNMDEAVPAKDREKYLDNLWNAASFEGSNYAIPWYVTTQVVMYNSNLFSAAGLDADKGPKSWDDIEKDAVIIKQKTGVYGFMPAIDPANFGKLLDDWQCQGIPVLSKDRKQALFNSPAAAARLQWYVDLYKNDIIPRETMTSGYQGAVEMYQRGNLGMLVSGPQFLLKIKLNAPDVYNATRVAPYPRGKAGIVPAAIMNFAVPRASRHKEEAVKLALFLTNDENQLQFCKRLPLLPSTKKAAADPFFIEGKGDPVQDEAIRISIMQLKHARNLSLGLKNWVDLGKALKDAIENSMYQRKTVQAALDEAAEKWDEILASGDQ